MNSPFIDRAVKEAEKVEHKFRLGAVIHKGGRLLSIGRNYYQRSARNLHPRYSPWAGSIHAEVDAILKAKKDLKGASLTIVRINKDKQLMLARPCTHCMLYLKHAGIKRIYYSTSSYPYEEVENL